MLTIIFSHLNRNNLLQFSQTMQDIMSDSHKFPEFHIFSEMLDTRQHKKHHQTTRFTNK